MIRTVPRIFILELVISKTFATEVAANNEEKFSV